MKKSDGRIDGDIRRLCRDIHHRADDREKLQTLVVRLQAVLREERYEDRAVKSSAPSDDPYDKIMII